MWMNLDEIKELLQALSASDVAELELETDKVRLHLKKAVVFAPQESQRNEGTFPRPLVTGQVLPLEVSAAPSEQETVIIAAPMVGTFYRAPAPDAPPYVEVGDSIEEGQPLCIIEAMKLMNEIEADVAGIIKEILVENQQPVEYGQPLFIVEKLA
ncbi:MAG: acetyl-CoA carboxylase biotin carboxyl carrier protein [Limnochordia bacterium]|jgi:acetyl-CoA carboxylase biotin carboxyl carrier protein